MKTALVTLSAEGLAVAEQVRSHRPDATLYVHESVTDAHEGERFTKVTELTPSLFAAYNGIVYILPCGVAVRAIAPCIEHKCTDPAVVVVDVHGRWAVSLLSGHEGGANDLALAVANALDAEPIISTTSEAVKDLIVGVGCRKDIEALVIEEAIRSTLTAHDLSLERVRLLATADVKRDEPGLLAAAASLGVPLRIISSASIRSCPIAIQESSFVQGAVGLPAVAEPAALLAGRRTTLLVPKTPRNGVTVAIARED